MATEQQQAILETFYLEEKLHQGEGFPADGIVAGSSHQWQSKPLRLWRGKHRISCLECRFRWYKLTTDRHPLYLWTRYECGPPRSNLQLVIDRTVPMWWWIQRKARGIA